MNKENNNQINLKNLKAIGFMKRLLNEDPSYDKEIWKKLKKSIEDNRLSYRKRFNNKKGDKQK